MEPRALWMPDKRGFLKVANSELWFRVQQFHFHTLDPCTLSCKQYHRDIFFYTWLLSSSPHAEVIFMPSPFSFSCLHNSGIFKHTCTYHHPYFPGKQNPRMSPWLPSSLPLAFGAVILYINLILKQTLLSRPFSACPTVELSQGGTQEAIASQATLVSLLRCLPASVCPDTWQAQIPTSTYLICHQVSL